MVNFYDLVNSRKLKRYICFLCVHDLGRDYTVVVHDAGMDVGEHPIIVPAQKLIILPKSFIIL